MSSRLPLAAAGSLIRQVQVDGGPASGDPRGLLRRDAAASRRRGPVHAPRRDWGSAGPRGQRELRAREVLGGAPAVGRRVAARRRGLRVQAPRTFRPCSRNLTLRADVPVDERLRTRFCRDTRTILAGHRRREEPEPFVVGEFAIDYGRRRVTVGGAPVKLTATEYRR